MVAYSSEEVDQQFGRHGEHKREIPLIVGSVFGHRTWVMREGTGLCSPFKTSFEWGPGVITSDCWECNRGKWYRPQSMLKNYYGSSYRRHVNTMDKCSCGFYAYFSRFKNDFAHNDINLGRKSNVVGIIEGTGETLIGTRGFRAEKAKIVALAPNGVHGWEWINPVAYGRLRRELKEMFPDVKIYRSRWLMYRKFPLTKASEFSDGD